MGGRHRINVQLKRDLSTCSHTNYQFEKDRLKLRTELQPEKLLIVIWLGWVSFICCVIRVLLLPNLMANLLGLIDPPLVFRKTVGLFDLPSSSDEPCRVLKSFDVNVGNYCCELTCRNLSVARNEKNLSLVRLRFIFLRTHRNNQFNKMD